MVTVHEQDRAGLAAIGGIDQGTTLPGLLDGAPDGCRLGADNGDEPLGRNQVAKANIQ